MIYLTFLFEVNISFSNFFFSWFPYNFSLRWKSHSQTYFVQNHSVILLESFWIILPKYYFQHHLFSFYNYPNKFLTLFVLKKENFFTHPIIISFSKQNDFLISKKNHFENEYVIQTWLKFLLNYVVMSKHALNYKL